METPEATGAIVPLEVSPELLEPLVTVVAVLGELGATAGDVSLTGTPGSLRGGLVALIATIRQAMSHRPREATRLSHALATAGTTRATTGTTPEPAVPRATTGDARASVATTIREWQKAVAWVKDTWDKVASDATRLKDACGTVATAEATAGTTAGHLAAAVAQQGRAHQDMVAATRALPLASDLATAFSELSAHRTRVADAWEQLRAATEATEKTARAMVGTAAAAERRRRAAAATEPLGRLVAACHGATRFYGHLQHLLKDIEASVAAGCGGPERGHGGPEAPGVAQEGRGVPEDLMAAVAAAETLWDASARLAQGHLLKTLAVARGLLVTLGDPDATAATTVAQRCRDATAALPGLLLRGRP